MSKVKALALLSGGLDSTLAAKLILEQGIEVEAINFVSPFCLCKKGGCGAIEVARELKIPLRLVRVGTDYLEVVKKPKHGYGRNMNPCIDCRIFMLKRANEYAKKKGASFIFTGEVLDERPMSQHMKAMKTIEREAGLEGRLLRPLSAKLLPTTEAERRGIVDRRRLLDIRGRGRKRQIELAAKFSIADYPCPAGGCLLTYKEFAAKLRDLFRHNKKVSLKSIRLLKIGRHFRDSRCKIIVGRNEKENNILLRNREPNEICFEAVGCGSPIALLQGTKTKHAVRMAARLTAYHSDKKQGMVEVKYGKGTMNKSVRVIAPNREKVDQLRI